MRRKKRIEELERLVHDLDARLQAAQTDAGERMGHFDTIIDGHDATLDTTSRTLQAMQARIDELEVREADDSKRVEARLAELTEQLVRQVEELGNEVSTAADVARRADEQAKTAGTALGDVTSAQVKLANEQVRYDLALRAELAELAERLRRSGRG